MTNPNAQHFAANIRSLLYQVGTGIQITVVDIYGQKITGTVVEINSAGLPLAIISERKIYLRHQMTEFFYCL